MKDGECTRNFGAKDDALPCRKLTAPGPHLPEGQRYVFFWIDLPAGFGVIGQ
jgi:hypothetical protein